MFHIFIMKHSATIQYISIRCTSSLYILLSSEAGWNMLMSESFARPVNNPCQVGVAINGCAKPNHVNQKVVSTMDNLGLSCAKLHSCFDGLVLSHLVSLIKGPCHRNEIFHI